MQEDIDVILFLLMLSRSNTPQNSTYPVIYLISHKPFELDEQDMHSTAGEARTIS